MTEASKGYVLITAAKNEEAYIGNTLESVIHQVRRPDLWLVVSDGSTDRTDEIVAGYAARFDFIRLLRLDNRAERSFSSKSFALNQGFDTIKHLQFDFVGILDADVSFGADVYDQLLARFSARPRLGLAGGVTVEECAGRWDVRPGDTFVDVNGQMQLFRKECYEDVGGFPPLRWGGEDTYANFAARRKGWETSIFRDLPVRHYRPTGTAGASAHRALFRSGLCDYFIGYHPLFEMAKCVRRLFVRPYVAGSVLHFCGFVWAHLTRQSPSLPADFVRYLRRHQMKRLLRAGGIG